MKLSFKLLAATPIAALLAGCIGGGNPGVNVSTAPQIASSFVTIIGTLPQSNTTPSLPSFSGAGGVTTANFKISTGVNVADKKISSSRAPASVTSCYNFTPDPGTDADGDGVAATKTYTFDCTNTFDAGTKYTWKGSMKIVDKNDTGGPAGFGVKGGYRYDFDMPEFTYEAASGTINTYSHKGFWEGSGTDTTTNYVSDYTGGVKGTYDYPALGRVSIDYAYVHKFKGSYTHNVGWTQGTITYAGDYSWNGTYISENAAGKHELKDGNANMKIATDALTFDSACAKWYKSGSWLLTDNNGSVMKITYFCSVAKLYFNGTEIDDDL